MLGISASVFEAVKQQSREAGCHDFLTKPVQVETLLEKLGIYLHLEWIIAQDPLAAVSSVPQANVVLPPQDDLRALLEASKIGDILEVHNLNDHIEQLNTAYLPFTTKIRELARSFQINQLRLFIEAALRGDIQGSADQGGKRAQ